MEETVIAPADAWIAVRNVIGGPLPEIARRFSQFIAPTCPHEAVVIFTRECTGRPRKIAGVAAIVDRVTIDELDTVKRSIPPGDTYDGPAVIAGAQRRVWAVHDIGGTLLVLIPRRTQLDIRNLAAARAVFGIVATSIHQQVAQASPDFLAESRAASIERARTITELTEVHEAALSSILGTLRSSDLDDRRSRITASETASAALIALRSAPDNDRALSEEAVTTAFARLQGELRPLLRYRNVEVDYVEPPADGRPLPGEIAHAARAMVRSIVLAFTAQPTLQRLRIAWDCDGSNVLIDVRDQGAGGIDRNALSRQLSGRLKTLRGALDIESLDGWGSKVALTVPLDPPAARPNEQLLAALNARELEVLGHLAVGRRNKAIAATLGISESTVKFHVASVLKKLEVANRGEAAAIGVQAGVMARPDKVRPA
ncbi:helix-turn-helix transcriptional regulator [Nocardia australiensis]|uniref:helix-turn-helix transcriptional regulator n=1 Tax=Nocardia australiensis TaxID=2887191 RepID=UPI001D14954C|nr:LuxR C-terminal-related transcriptional regulator [Nocardia australiensis]